MKTVLIVITLVEVVLLVAVLATYLIIIAAKLRKVSSTLGLVTFGVRAIEKQTEPIGPLCATSTERSNRSRRRSRRSPSRLRRRRRLRAR